MKRKIKMKKIDVLDKGYVEYIDHLGDDLTVVNAARVSFNKQSDWDGEQDWKGEWKNKALSDKDKKLITYLAKHKHWTPFAHPQITLRIKAPIFVRTQLFKHKVGFTENEISRRYVTFEPEVYVPFWRGAPTNGAKQGSSDFILDDNLVEQFNIETEQHNKKALELYNKLITNNIAPEQARAVLPQGTYTEWWWTGSLSAYARVYSQRVDTHAQWEVQQYAMGISSIISMFFPASWEALTNMPNNIPSN
jgi:thymidylate synthase (FAD)